jgi:hypothetical protein
MKKNYAGWGGEFNLDVASNENVGVIPKCKVAVGSPKVAGGGPSADRRGQKPEISTPYRTGVFTHSSSIQPLPLGGFTRLQTAILLGFLAI